MATSLRAVHERRQHRDSLWPDQNYRAQTNDRINFTIMREIPGQFKVDATWFMNYRPQRAASSSTMNMADPNLSYTYKAQLSQNIANPFYNYLTPEVFPGRSAQPADR